MSQKKQAAARIVAGVLPTLKIVLTKMLQEGTRFASWPVMRHRETGKRISLLLFIVEENEEIEVIRGACKALGVAFEQAKEKEAKGATPQ